MESINEKFVIVALSTNMVVFHNLNSFLMWFPFNLSL